METRVTMSDIAKRAGVSKATVSIVLSNKGKGSVRPETYERIQAAAHELGYQRKLQAKPKVEQSGTIGYLIPERHTSENGSEYLRRLLTGVLQGLKGKSYQLVQDVVDDNGGIPDPVRLGKVDGVVVNGECNPDWVRRLTEVIPVVWLNAFDHFNQGCFTSTIRPEQSYKLPCPDGQIDAFNRFYFLERFFYISNFDQILFLIYYIFVHQSFLKI